MSHRDLAVSPLLIQTLGVTLRSPLSPTPPSHCQSLLGLPTKELASSLTPILGQAPPPPHCLKPPQLSPPTHPPHSGYSDCPKAEAIRHSPPQHPPMVLSGFENKIQELWPAHMALCDRLLSLFQSFSPRSPLQHQIAVGGCQNVPGCLMSLCLILNKLTL